MLPQGGPAKQSPHPSCLVLDDDLRVISCHRTARQNGRAATPGGHRPFRLTACKCDGGATIPVERETAGGEGCGGGGLVLSLFATPLSASWFVRLFHFFCLFVFCCCEKVASECNHNPSFAFRHPSGGRIMLRSLLV